MTQKQKETIRKLRKSLDGFRRKGYDKYKFICGYENKEVKQAQLKGIQSQKLQDKKLTLDIIDKWFHIIEFNCPEDYELMKNKKQELKSQIEKELE